jgi:virulence-associated protein VagC
MVILVYLDIDDFCRSAYNVRMNAINVTLTTSGNSVAVRLPKELLRMSGLTSKVRLEAKQGKIIISKIADSRDGWDAQIRALSTSLGDPTREFDDMSLAVNDGLEDLPWDGPSFEEWQKSNAKLS